MFGNRRLQFALIGMGAALLIVATLALTFGRGRAKMPRRGTVGADGVCRAPLGLYCVEKPLRLPVQASRLCPSYSDALRRAKDEELAINAETGTCGELKWVMWSTGFVGETSYFNSKDELVGVEGVSDGGGYCSNNSHVIVYGNRPNCEKRVTMTLKPKSDRP